MWFRALRLACLLAVLMMAGCGPRASGPAGPVGSLQTPNAAAGEPEGPGPGVGTEEPGRSESEFREALTAREAWELAEAEAEARAQGPGYELYEVTGCHKAAPYGSYERDSHLVQGTCAQWMFFYVRPVEPGSAQGYTALYLRVGPNGVLEAVEKPHEAQVRKQPIGVAAGWAIDSPEAIEIAEEAGGRAYREANPEWDTARFEADRNALLMATLHTRPYFEPDSGEEYAGSDGLVWTVTYPPLRALLYVIDGTTGEVLLEQD